MAAKDIKFKEEARKHFEVELRFGKGTYQELAVSAERGKEEVRLGELRQSPRLQWKDTDL